MTFVAQPYEQIADDILTALTGGTMREEHKFVQTEESYSLASPGARENSIKITGQRKDAFVLFEKGIDYDYDTQEEFIKWKDGGRWPDDQTFFYVNYYLKEGRRRLTDRNPGSVTATLAEAFAREFAVLNKQMEIIYKSAFVDLANGPSLEHVAALLGISRKDARFASGECLFKRSTPAPGDITIPAGTLVSTADGQNFETTIKRTLRKGQLSVVSSIRAQVEGPVGRVKANDIKNINRPIFGVESVTNEKETFFAAEKETDEELRRRIKGTLERAGKSTVDAIKFGLIENIPEITEANIQVADRPGARGIVDVKLGLIPDDKPDLVHSIEESIERYRPAGVRVVHNLSTRTKSESEEQAEAEQPTVIQDERKAARTLNRTKHKPDNIPPEDLNEMPDNVLKLGAEIYLKLNEENLSVLQKEGIQDAARDRVMEYVENLPMGSDVIYNKLLGFIVQPDEIVDASLRLFIVSGKARKEQSPYANLATNGRKATILACDIVGGLMEETVLINILIQVEKDKDPDENQNEEKMQITKELIDRMEASIETAINEIFADDEINNIQKADLEEAIKGEISQMGFHLTETNPVALNAEYEETGLLLNNTDNISLEEYQVPKLSNIKVEIKEELDG
ncbi:MAG: baseplate J/gp47 family protein [Desulfobacteraceae bacterium]|nr:baseplate J/gp47 family protein [Desulfobacteraceae bacterium]